MMQARVVKEDLLKLVKNLEDDSEDENIFADVDDSGPPADQVPAKRSRTKQRMPMAPAAPVQAAHIAEDEKEIKFPKAFQRQMDKEVSWEDIPQAERPLYVEAERK